MAGVRFPTTLSSPLGDFSDSGALTLNSRTTSTTTAGVSMLGLLPQNDCGGGFVQPPNNAGNNSLLVSSSCSPLCSPFCSESNVLTNPTLLETQQLLGSPLIPHQNLQQGLSTLVQQSVHQSGSTPVVAPRPRAATRTIPIPPNAIGRDGNLLQDWSLQNCVAGGSPVDTTRTSADGIQSVSIMGGGAPAGSSSGVGGGAGAAGSAGLNSTGASSCPSPDGMMNLGFGVMPSPVMGSSSPSLVPNLRRAEK